MEPNPNPDPDHATMESSITDTNSCSFVTNWTVSGGSLTETVTFESSISPIDDEQAAVNSISRSPLILSPPPSDSSPCEITLNFMQKHEVRQVYVRSTARVYEIYYAHKKHSTNEYLCTVRCDIAAKDEDMEHPSDFEEAVSSQLKGSSGELAEGRLKNDSNLTTSEDEWVEVRVLETPQLDNRKVSLPSKTGTYPGRSTQDFYEATAEITDADACTSLTLRLLSLQSKGCVYIDEFYVFADPVDSAGSEDQAVQVENSAGSSLMAMFMPTLMQLSRTRGINGIDNQHTFNTREKQKVPEVGSEAAGSTNIATMMQEDGKYTIADSTNVTIKTEQDGKLRRTDQQEVKSQAGAAVGPAQLQSPPQVPNAQDKPDFPMNSRIEMALDQLVSRVSKIEELCLRFEENMLKPISGIEKRLQRVEEQLEVLTKKSEISGSYTRFFAPEFSWYESDSNFHSSGSYLNCGALESGEKDTVQPDDISASVNDIRLLPSLVVTAPEFCNGDDEEENHSSEPVTDSPKDKPKQALSIDDALASALTGFLSSTSFQSGKYTQSLAVKAPEFPSEDGSADKKASHVKDAMARNSSVCFDLSDGSDCLKDSVVSSVCFDETEGTYCTKDSVSCSSNTSIESERNVTTSIYNDCSVEVTDEVDTQYQHNEDGEGSSYGSHIEKGKKQDTEITKLACLTDDIENVVVSNGTSNVLIPDETDVPNQFVENEDNDSSGINHDDAGDHHCTDLTVDAEVKKGSTRDILQSVVKFSHASSVVDFEIPILDVKFVSQENFASKSPLEALLASMPESNTQAHIVEEVEDGSPTGEQCDLITVDDGELTGHASDNHFFVDMNYFNPVDMLKSIDGETLQEKCSGNQEVLAASLI